MKLGIITYDAPHLKTQQVAARLAERDIKMCFFALPFVNRPARKIAFHHRPEMAAGMHARDVATSVGARYQPVATANEVSRDVADLFLILGAGILPATFVRATSGRVLNSHPGIIPLVRGLDSFKWAILDGMPIGNTLHLIDERPDAGRVLTIRPTPVYADDTLASFAHRHYEREIDLMVNFADHLAEPFTSPVGSERSSRMRMPASIETQLPQAFEAYKALYAGKELELAH